MSPDKPSQEAIAPIANSADEWRAAMELMAQSHLPSFFHLRAKLPKQGRTNQVLAATRHMNVVLKTYASGGENELHAHSNEDHLFVVLQGEAVFHGPRGERREVAKNDAVLIPANSQYRFNAKENAESLVMLRIGCALDPDQDVLARVDAEGRPFDGYSERNKEVPYVLHEDKIFE